MGVKSISINEGSLARVEMLKQIIETSGRGINNGDTSFSSIMVFMANEWMDLFLQTLYEEKKYYPDLKKKAMNSMLEKNSDTTLNKKLTRILNIVERDYALNSVFTQETLSGNPNFYKSFTSFSRDGIYKDMDDHFKKKLRDDKNYSALMKK